MSRPLPVLLLPALLACGEPSAEPAEPLGSERLELSAVDWTLAWKLERGERLGKTGWAVTTDLGYRVEVTGGRLVDYSVALDPCEAEEGEVLAGLGERLLSLGGVGTAHAHHGEFEDPSLLDLSHVEDPSRLATTRLAAVDFPAADYCGVYWLVARADDGTFDADGAAVPRVSLQLTGSWSRGTSAGKLAIGTDLALAGVRELAELELEAEKGALSADRRALSITLTRDADRLFDGVDFATVGSDALAWAVVDNLVAQTEVSARVRAR